MSRRSRIANSYRKDVFLGEDKEHLVLFIKDYLKKEHIDYFIFGHRHITLDLKINNSRYINIGEWVNKRSYAIFDGEQLEVRTFDIE
jgi:UDP-2,3-diacylglucosamine hydrolase